MKQQTRIVAVDVVNIPSEDRRSTLRAAPSGGSRDIPSHHVSHLQSEGVYEGDLLNGLRHGQGRFSVAWTADRGFGYEYV
eukprot:gene8531-10857_t